MEFKEKDPVLDKAVEILKEGTEKILAQKAEKEKQAQEPQVTQEETAK